MESTIQNLKDRLNQAEEELAYLKTTALERSQCHATHRAFWQVRDAYKELTHLIKEIKGNTIPSLPKGACPRNVDTWG